MKKIIIPVIVLTLGLTSVMAQDVKIKKGKATMSEDYYNALLEKANAYDQAVQENAKLHQQLDATTPRTFVDSASYAIGRDVYTQWSQQKIGIDGAMAAQGMKDAATGKSVLSDRETRPLLQRFQQDFERRQRAGVQENIDAGKKYLEQVSMNKSVHTTASGLRYRAIKEGNGHRPTKTDRVRVHYTGTLIDGTKFDSSVDRGEPITFQLNQVIPGWTEGLQLMDEGSKYMLYVPYNLGYGEQQAGAIPPGSTLIFEVELLQINP